MKGQKHNGKGIKPYIEKGQIIQWQKDKQWSTKQHTEN